MRANVCTRRLSFPIIEDLEQSAKGAKRGDKRMRGMADVSKGSVLMRRCTNQWRRVRTQEPNAIKRREVEVEVGRGGVGANDSDGKRCRGGELANDDTLQALNSASAAKFVASRS